MEAEDRLAFQEDLRFSRKMDHKLQKERLEELAPRADAGTRERQLEKKREVNDKMRAFREKSPVEEVGEAELMGDDGLDGFKKKKKEMERKKNERELRKEEMLRVRALRLYSVHANPPSLTVELTQPGNGRLEPLKGKNDCRSTAGRKKRLWQC